MVVLRLLPSPEAMAYGVANPITYLTSVGGYHLHVPGEGDMEHDDDATAEHICFSAARLGAKAEATSQLQEITTPP